MKNKLSKELPTRDTLVRNLTPDQAGDLLVHSHTISPERRKALLFFRGPVSAYFTEEQAAQMREWIANEQYLPQDCKEFDHPKLPTHWCGYCGQVVSCEHDRLRRSERSTELGILVTRDDGSATTFAGVWPIKPNEIAVLKHWLSPGHAVVLVQDEDTVLIYRVAIQNDLEAYLREVRQLTGQIYFESFILNPWRPR